MKVQAVGVAVQHVSRPDAEDQEQYDVYLLQLLLQSGLSVVTDLTTAWRASNIIGSFISLYSRTAADGCSLLMNDCWRSAVLDDTYMRWRASQEELGIESGASTGGVLEFFDWLVGQFGSNQGTEAAPGRSSLDIIQEMVRRSWHAVV